LDNAPDGSDADLATPCPLRVKRPKGRLKHNPSALPLAELDFDIIIDEAPDSLTPQIEQFQALVELKKFDQAGEIPFRAIVRAMPNLKDKQAFLEDMEAQAAQRAQGAGPPQQPPELQQLQLRGAAAELAETESKAALNFAKAESQR
jgi:hypothetical protein